MNLSPPTTAVFIISLILAVLAIIGTFVAIPLISVSAIINRSRGRPAAAEPPVTRSRRPGRETTAGAPGADDGGRGDRGGRGGSVMRRIARCWRPKASLLEYSFRRASRSCRDDAATLWSGPAAEVRLQVSGRLQGHRVTCYATIRYAENPGHACRLAPGGAVLRAAWGM